MVITEVSFYVHFLLDEDRGVIREDVKRRCQWVSSMFESNKKRKKIAKGKKCKRCMSKKLVI